MNFIHTISPSINNHLFSKSASKTQTAADKVLCQNPEILKQTAVSAFSKFDTSLKDIKAAIMGKPNTVLSRIKSKKGEVRNGKVVYVTHPDKEEKVTLTLDKFFNNRRPGEQESRCNDALRVVFSSLGKIETFPELPGHEELAGSDGKGRLLDQTICTDDKGPIPLRDLVVKDIAKRVEKKISEERVVGNKDIESNLLNLMDAIHKFGSTYYLKDSDAPTGVVYRRPTPRQITLLADYLRQTLSGDDLETARVAGDKQAQYDELKEIAPDQLVKPRDFMKSDQKEPSEDVFYDVSEDVSHDVPEDVFHDVTEDVSRKVPYDVLKDSAYLGKLSEWVDKGADSVTHMTAFSSDEKRDAVSMTEPQPASSRPSTASRPLDMQTRKDLMRKMEAKESLLSRAKSRLDAINAERSKYENMTPSHAEEKGNRLAFLEEKIKSRNSSRFSTINDLRRLRRERQFTQAGKLYKSDDAYKQELNGLRSWMKEYQDNQPAKWKNEKSELEKEIVKLVIELKQLREELEQ